MLVRCNDQVELCEAMLAILAVTACGLEAEISLAARHAKVIRQALEGLPDVRVIDEEEEALVARLAKLKVAPELVRYLGEVPLGVYQRANEWHVPVADDPAVPVGRLELRCYFREQSVSQTVHRYGNLIDPPAPRA